MSIIDKAQIQAGVTKPLHLTIGVAVVTWRDEIRDALDEAAKEELMLRRGVPEDGRAPDGLLDALASRLTPAAVSRRRRRKHVSERRAIRPDAFDQLRALESLALETPLERRDTVIADLAVEGDEARVAFEGRELVLPARVAGELSFVIGAEEPFGAAELPGNLDEESRLVLVRRLVREGLLRIRVD